MGKSLASMLNKFTDLDEAEAIVIDMEGEGILRRDQGSDFAALLARLLSVNERIGDVLQFRVLREVQTRDCAPNWGTNVGEIVDTTGYDSHFAMFSALGADPNNHWYLDEGVSSAYLVIENKVLVQEDGSTVFKKQEDIIPVVPLLKNATETEMKGVNLMGMLLNGFFAYPLPRSGMEPSEIVAEVKRLVSNY